MDRPAELWRRLLYLFRRGQFDRDLEEEMRFHLEMKAQQNRDAGMNSQEARHAARRKFGNATRLAERSRETWGWPAIESCVKDVRIAVRSLRRNPSFSALAILTLALGIGANTAVFSVVQGVLLRPLPFRDPDRIVMVWDQWPKRGEDRVPASAPEFSAWKTRSKSLESIAAIAGASSSITIAGEPTKVPGVAVSAGFFETLGVTPAAGRLFSSEEQQHSGHDVAVISFGLAQRLGGNMVGKAVRMAGGPRVVIGVMPREFAFPNDREIWFPLPVDELARTSPGNHNYSIVARLKPGIPIKQAQAELAAIEWPFQREYEAVHGAGVAVIPVRDEMVGATRRALLVLLGVVACLLLIACANVANLTLSRAAGRSREIAVRVSLGAGRWRIARHLLAESAVLALAGGALGLAGAYWGVRAFTASNPIELPRVREIAVDPGVLLFTLGVALATALLIGLVTAFRLSRPDLNAALKEAAGTQVAGGFRGNRTRSVLAAVQVAVAIVVLAGSGLLLRSFIERISVPLGFRPEGALGFELPWWAHERIDELLARLRSLPGVQTAGAGTSFPLDPTMTTSGSFKIEGRPQVPEAEPRGAHMVVTPDYFRAAGMELRKGRLITQDDVAQTAPVAVISESLARHYFPGEEPIGNRLRWGGPAWATVVGVVADVKGFGMETPLPTIYFPHTQEDWNNGVYGVVRSTLPPASIAATVRREIRAWSRSILISRLAPLPDMLSDSVAVPRFYMLFVAAFAAIALAIAAVGLYGALNCLVTQRTHEIGVRMALGADRGGVLRSVVRQGLAIVFLGMVFGLAGAWASTRVLASLLFRVRPDDGVTFVAVSMLLAAVGALACYIPARRATRINPIEALRYE